MIKRENMKEKLKIFRSYLTTGIIFYLIFWQTLYFFSTLIVLGLYIWYCFRSILKLFDTPMFEQTIIDNQMNIQKIAKATYRWNPLARFLLITIMEKHLQNVKSGTSTKKFYQPCLEKFGIFDEQFNSCNEDELKFLWKKLVRENHPDKFQDENIKLTKTQETAELNNCKDILLKVIQSRTSNA